MINSIEMRSVVKAYIFHLKGVEVDVREPRSIREMTQLSSAYSDAIKFFNNNNGSIKLTGK